MIVFPFGKAAFSILLLTILAWAALAFDNRRPDKPSTLTYWTFTKEHYDNYKKLIPEFEKTHPGVTVDLQLVSNNALASRLQAAFLADLDVPDICELEIGSAGTMFRGPVKDIGFIDLKPRLVQSGLYDRIVKARFAPYTSRGEIFGLPHDVHPVQIAYRRDIFEQCGVDPDKIQTWDDFVRAGQKVTIPGKRYMIELSDSDVYGGGLETLLLQRGGGYFDPGGHVIFDNDTAVQAMEAYVPMVAGPKKIGNTVGDQYGAQFAKALEDGYEVCVLCPDWRSHVIQDNVAHVAGKMALMPLPAAEVGGRRTSTWGGTMLGITKHCKHQDIAWQLAVFLYTNREQIDQAFPNVNILPPIKDAWTVPSINKPNAYWSNQKLGTSYAKLAPEVPAQYTSPEIDTAKAQLSNALISCVRYYNDRGDDAGFDPFVRSTLHKSAARVRTVIARNPY